MNKYETITKLTQNKGDDLTKKSFVLYTNYAKYFAKLSTRERGELITAIFDYHITGKSSETLTDKADMAFAFICDQLDRDREKYKSRCKKNADPDLPDEEISENDTDNDTDNDTVTATATATDVRTNIRAKAEEEAAETKVREKDFTEFWNKYPKHFDKRSARTAYFTEVKNKKDHAELLALVEKWRFCTEWQEEGGRWVKKAERFLTEVFPTRDVPPSMDFTGSFDTDEFFHAALMRSYAT